MIVYIAGPYSKGDPVLNTISAVKAAEQVRALGHLPFIPHLCHLWHLISPHEYEYWTEMDMEWLKVCDCIIRLPGESKGADAEVSRMIKQFKPIFYSVEEFAEKTTARLPAAPDPTSPVESNNSGLHLTGGLQRPQDESGLRVATRRRHREMGRIELCSNCREFAVVQECADGMRRCGNCAGAFSDGIAFAKPYSIAAGIRGTWKAFLSGMDIDTAGGSGAEEALKDEPHIKL